MLKITVDELMQNLIKAFYETFIMCSTSMLLAILLGIPIGLFIYITRKGLFQI